MTTENIVTGTWLPVFPGFYGTVMEWLIESANDYDHEDIKDSDRPEELKEAMLEHYYESKAYYASIQPMEDSIAKQCVNIIEAELKSQGFVEKIEFDELISPKEYNFANDSINVTVTFSAENVKKIRTFISEHFPQWKKYLKGTYTSCDGFMSFHSNEPGAEEWFVDNALNDRHNAGSVLEFICGELEINQETLFNQCESVEGIDIDALEKECIEQGWYVPDTLWNRLKAKWENKPRFKRIGLWCANQYVMDTRKYRYIFAVTKEDVTNKDFKVYRLFKVFVFGRLKNEKEKKS